MAALRTASRIFFELGGDLGRDLQEEAADELARFLEGWSTWLGPVREPAHPELVVLVEVPLLALREVLAAALQPVLESGKRLVTVDVDALRLGLHLVFEVVQILLALVVVDRRNDRGGEVEDLLELPWRAMSSR